LFIFASYGVALRGIASPCYQHCLGAAPRGSLSEPKLNVVEPLVSFGLIRRRPAVHRLAVLPALTRRRSSGSLSEPKLNVVEPLVSFGLIRRRPAVHRLAVLPALTRRRSSGSLSEAKLNGVDASCWSQNLTSWMDKAHFASKIWVGPRNQLFSLTLEFVYVRMTFQCI
jgi:hypothetical protein